MLTTGVDSGAAFTGGAGNDTFNATIDATNTPSTATWTALDVIDGGNGNDTLKINAITDVAVPGGATVTNIENVTLAAAAKIGTFAANGTGALDLSTVFAGVTNLTVTSGSQADFKAGSSTAVNLSGVTGGVEVVGGASQTVSLADQGAAVQLSGTKGAVSVTSLKQDTAGETITIDGGSTVTVNTTSTSTNDAINIGATTQATGAVSVTSNLNGDGKASIDQADITVKGGSTVTVNSNLTITAADKTASSAHTFGDVKVTGDSKTTDVTVTQSYSETEFAAVADVVVAEKDTVTFKAMTAGQTLTASDGALTLTFTATKALTADQVAAAFANLVNGDTQSATGSTANGYYSGSFSNTAGAKWTSAAASGATVVFTAADEAETNITWGGTATAPTVANSAGSKTAGSAVTSNTVTYGAVVVEDNATASIKTVTLNGFGTTTIGATDEVDALTTLSLANSSGAVEVNFSAAKTSALDLTVNKVANAVDLDGTVGAGGANLKTLNVTATGADSTFGLTAAAVETLTVAGDKVLDIDTGSTLTALKTVTVSGSAGLSIVATGANVTSVNTSATTGTVTATIDASKATYTGGEGVDAVTLAASTVAKNIALGGGNDTLNASAATLTGTFTFDGGTGTNTLTLGAAQADALDNDATFEGKISNFSKLSLGQVATGTQNTVNLANMDDINYVITAGTFDTKQVGTITFAGTEATGADDVLTTTITDAGGTSTFTTTVAAGTAATAVGTDVSVVTKTSSTATYTAVEAAGVVTISSNTDYLPFAVSTVLTTGTAGEITAGTLAITSSQLTLNNLANNGTVELTAAGTGVVVNITDAATGTADVLNLVTTDLASVTVGTVVANGVETINVTTTDTFVDANKDGKDDANSAATLGLVSDKVTKVNVTGAGDITLVATDTTLTEVDASTLSGILTFTAKVNDLVVKGGTAADALTANANDVKLYGNGGGDTLTVAGGLRVNLYGGDGADTFVVNTTASASLDAYTVINGVASGDTIKMGDATKFSGTKIALSVGADETLLNYANQATKLLAENEMGWFQRGGNTYIVLDQTAGAAGAGGAADTFDGGVDQIIMIVGLVDLSTASYNSTSNTLEIA